MTYEHLFEPVFAPGLHAYYERHLFDAPADVVLRTTSQVRGDFGQPLRKYTFEHVDRRTIDVFIIEGALASDYVDVSNFLAKWAEINDKEPEFDPNDYVTWSDEDSYL